jgi:glycosyltransferase involved in cell wall biosynthesis
VVEIAVVSPVYGCGDCLVALHERLTATLSALTPDYEIILVDDRSPDDAWPVMRELAAKDPHVKIHRLSRNFGQHAAITAGLTKSTGRWTVVMDCDLQDPPEHIATLYAKAQEGHDVVVSRRDRRVGTVVRRSSGRLFYWVYNALTSGSDIYSNMGNYSILSRRALDAFLRLNEKDRQYLLIVHWIGFDRAEVTVPVAPRAAGESAYGFLGLMRVATDGMFFFTTRLLRWIVYLGFAIALLGVLLTIYTGIKFALGGEVSQFSGLSTLILLMSGFIICSTGVSALYIGKIFEQVKERPLYLLDDPEDE